ncbi:MAG TPA: hypothetical protein PLW43_07675, partial [Chitinophagales bacterium]|nr:hypothetical protein [Chitinophagales bacterium]
AISICIKNGLIISDTMKFEADLKYIFWKSSPYAGNFIFKVTQHLPPVVTEGICPIKCKTETLYREWIINPWNSELLEHKRYKRLDQWSNGNGGGESIEIKD